MGSVITIWILDGWDGRGNYHSTCGRWWGAKPSVSQIKESLDSDILPEELVDEAAASLYADLKWQYTDEDYNSEYEYNLYTQEVYKGEGEINK